VRQSSLRALVTIIYGCNNWCSYCIVPAVRGPERSRSAGTILDEIQALVGSGCREVTLLGQNVNSYRDEGIDFASLLEQAAAVPDLWRIRYITSHPRDASERHLDAVARLENVCESFHLPVQSGSTPVLERMNRGYTRAHYLGLIERIRRQMPGAAISTDIIVGFPGETDSDYEQTLDLVRQVRFDSAFTFLYTPREGAKSATWADDVPLEVKKERLARLIALQEQISLEKNREAEGTAAEILVEGPARRAEANEGLQMIGRTRGNKCVIYDGEAADVGRLVEVKITEGASHTLFGQKVRTLK
jgi:tRNA-2-methylthio-N6-dimethylallyladenosine synthase